MAYSGGERVGRSGAKPIVFTPAEKKAIVDDAKEFATRYETVAPKTTRFGKLVEKMTQPDARRYGDSAEYRPNEPRTAGPEQPAIKTYDMRFVIEVLDKDGKVVAYHALEPRDPVTTYDRESPMEKGRTRIGFDGWRYGSGRFMVEMSVRDRALVMQYKDAIKKKYPGHTVKTSAYEAPKA